MIAAALTMVVLVASRAPLQDAATGTAPQAAFAHQALDLLRRGENEKLHAHVAARPFRASTLVHNLLRQSATEGADSWALGAARGIATALANVDGSPARGAAALAQVNLYASFDDERRAERLEFDAHWMRVTDAMNSGDASGAVASAVSAHGVAEALGDPWLTATSQRRMGRLSLDLGRMLDAEETFAAAIRSDERHGHLLDLAASHALLGHAHLQRGSPIKALAHYESSLAAVARTDATPSMDPLEYGFLLAHVGRFDEARAILDQALAAAESDAGRCDALVALGVLSNAEGHYAEARTSIEEAIEHARAGGAVLSEANARIVLGGLESELSQTAVARRQLSRALELLTGHDAPHRRASAWLHLATVELDDGDPSAALEATSRAADLYDALDHAMGRRAVLAVTARALDLAGEFEAADATWNECADQAERAGEQPAAALARVALAESLARRGETKRASKAAERALSTLNGIQLPELQWRAQAVLARALLADGRTEAALSAFDAAIATLERLRTAVHAPSLRSDYFDDRTDVHRSASIAYLEAGDVPRAFAAAEAGKARALLEAYGGVDAREAGKDVLLAATDELRRAERAYAAAIVASEDGMRSAQDALRLARIGLREARVARERAAPVRATLGGLGAAPTVAAIARVLPESTALVEYLIADEGTAAFIVANGRLHGVRLPDSRATIRSRIDDVLAPIEDLRAGRTDIANLAFDVGAAHALYLALVEPLEAHLDGIDTLVIVPDGALWHAPFAAFVVEVKKRAIDPGSLYAQHAAHRYLIDDLTIASIPSAATLLATASRAASAGNGSRSRTTSLFVADPLPKPTGAPALPFARAELERLSPGLGDTVLVGSSATEAGLRTHLRSARWLHLAVHGILDGASPSHSRLALARSGVDDGWLHAYEIETLDIRVDHVVLSACEGSGDARSGEGILGLTRAFLAAGAQSVLASRWMVEDRAVVAFMARYYDELQRPISPSQALARTQRWAAHEGGRPGTSFAHPFFWAGFAVFGLDG